MHRLLILLATGAALSSCSSLPVPGEGQAVHPAACAGIPAGRVVLARSARVHGDAWNRYRRVEVRYEGDWNRFVARLQPVLVDGGFRESMRETFEPRSNRIGQDLRGPGGTKLVDRRRPGISVSYNGSPSTDPEVLDASSLVADAHAAFLFGPSWLLEHGRDFELLANRELDGKTCQLVQGRLAPGIGNSQQDHFIAWVDEPSGILRRFQFTMNGLASTAGADAEVTFFDHWRSSDGSLWPGLILEYVQRPVLARAQQSIMTSLRLDGRSERGSR